jgi:hypothetical protein
VICVIDAAENKDPSEWFGFWSLEKGNKWAWNDTKFSKAVKTPNSLIIIKNFDSMSGRVANEMMGLFEGRKVNTSKGFISSAYWTVHDRPQTDNVYSCNEGVKFWLLGASKTDWAWRNHLIGNPRIEYME